MPLTHPVISLHKMYKKRVIVKRTETVPSKKCKIILKGANNRVVDIEITGANLLRGRDIEIIVIIHNIVVSIRKNSHKCCPLKDI